ncbi:MAG: hypothetical protein R3E87_20610 [Burkholderiaceae bacterium]
MIRFIRTVTMAPGITAQGIGFAHEMAAHLKNTLGLSTQVMVAVGGNPQRIGWYYECEDLAALDQGLQRMNADPTYHQMSSRTTDFFVAGSFEDTIWRSI